MMLNHSFGCGTTLLTVDDSTVLHPDRSESSADKLGTSFFNMTLCED